MKLLLLFILTFGFLWVQSQSETIKVMSYNLLNFSDDDGNRVPYLKTTMDSYMPDLLLVNELISEEGGLLILDSALNQNYSFAPFINGPDSDNGLFYRNDKFTFQQVTPINTDLRDFNMYELYYLDSAGNDTVFVTCISAHLKAGSSLSNEAQRTEETQVLMTYLNQLNDPTNIILGGDFNFYNSGEGGFQNIVNFNGYSLNDPLGNETNDIDWHSNWNYAHMHTQSTRISMFGGGANGGLDDRFDFLFVSDDLLNGGHKMRLISESYQAYGNDGNHLNDAINDLPLSNGFTQEEMDALHFFSDHLPIAASFEMFPDNVSISEIEDEFRFDFFIDGNQLNIALESNQELTASIHIYDIQGRSVLTDTLSIKKGTTFQSFPFHFVGMYFIQIPELGISNKFLNY